MTVRLLLWAYQHSTQPGLIFSPYRKATVKRCDIYRRTQCDNILCLSWATSGDLLWRGIVWSQFRLTPHIWCWYAIPSEPLESKRGCVDDIAKTQGLQRRPNGVRIPLFSLDTHYTKSLNPEILRRIVLAQKVLLHQIMLPKGLKTKFVWQRLFKITNLLFSSYFS